MRTATKWLVELISRQAMPECQLLVSDDWDADLNYPLEHLKLEHFGVANYEATRSHEGCR